MTESTATLIAAPPVHSLDAERAVLCAMILDRKATMQGMGMLSAAMMYDERHRIIFDAVVRMHTAGRGVDSITLAAELERLSTFDDAGGHIYLSEVVTATATAANIRHHAEVVRDMALDRAVRKIGHQMAEGTTEVPVVERIEGHRDSLGKLAARGTTPEFEASQDTMVRVCAAMDEAVKSEREFLGLDTGLHQLNQLTGGWMADDLIVVAARPSIGKTALVMSMALAAAKNEGVGVGIFSLEMSTLQVMQRLICLDAPIRLQALRKGSLTTGEQNRFVRACNDLAALPLFVDDTAGLEVTNLRGRAERLRQRHNIGLWVVDYMQLMRAGNGRANKREEVGYISNGLKALAKETATPVLALSQLSRAPEERGDKKPQLSDLRETGEIEQDADLVLLIHRPGKYGLRGADGEDLGGKAELLLDKHRNGATGYVEVSWLPERAKFGELSNIGSR